jgi:hypothetical protein
MISGGGSSEFTKEKNQKEGRVDFLNEFFMKSYFERRKKLRSPS